MSTQENADLRHLADKLDKLTETINKFITTSGERMTRGEVEREQYGREIRDLRDRVGGLERERATNAALSELSKSIGELRRESISKADWNELVGEVRDIDDRVEAIEKEGLVSKGKRMAYIAVAGAAGALAVGLFKGLAEAAIKLIS